MMGVLTIQGNDFLMDGKSTTILSGAIHYFRVVPEYWEDRLKKLRACGFNTVETYVCWNLHERRERIFDFSGGLDIGKFIDIAKELGLNVILRPGPYICAEWDMGGLPSWLMKYPNMRFRCCDPLFLEKVDKYYQALFSHITPRLSTNGGNIIAVQVENEYGSYGNDKKYLAALVNILKKNRVDCLLFTSDGAEKYMLNGGTIDDTLATVNFGSNPDGNFAALKEFRPNQPLMCMEYWNGWFDHWYEDHHTRLPQDTANVLDEILSTGASVNFYMFHGGTNFAFTNGANYSNVYQPTVTSYDYDCLVSECGDLTPKYDQVKAVLEKHFGKAPALAVYNLPKKAYGKVTLTKEASLLEHLSDLSAPVTSAFPLTMEELNQDFGFVLYSTTVCGPMKKLPLEIDGLHDRALIFINQELAGIKERTRRRNDEVLIQLAADESIQLDILVENMGRVNYGPKLYDPKGILRGVRIGQQNHFGWSIYPLPLEDLSTLQYTPFDGEIQVPTFLSGDFDINETADTFIRLDGFTKGVVFVNGFNIGRYWNTAGPQKTLYIPAPLLKSGENNITVLELEHCITNEVLLTDVCDLG